MKCPRCKTEDELGVIDSRKTYNGVRRKRLCKYCGYRFTTMEKVVLSERDLKAMRGEADEVSD